MQWLDGQKADTVNWEIIQGINKLVDYFELCQCLKCSVSDCILPGHCFAVHKPSISSLHNFKTQVGSIHTENSERKRKRRSGLKITVNKREEELCINLHPSGSSFMTCCHLHKHRGTTFSLQHFLARTINEEPFRKIQFYSTESTQRKTN